jgi:peroxiredoxin
VDNGIIEKLFVEAGQRDNADSDPYEVSTPDNVLGYVSANVKVGATI